MGNRKCHTILRDQQNEPEKIVLINEDITQSGKYCGNSLKIGFGDILTFQSEPQ
jgi:hypothetical protein